MHQTFQFAVPDVESVLGQRNGRLRNNFSGNEQVVEPEEDTSVVGCHSGEIEKRPRLIRETGIGDNGPRSQMHTRRKAETNSDSEKRPAKRKAEIERKANDKNQKSGFNQVDRLL